MSQTIHRNLCGSHLWGALVHCGISSSGSSPACICAAVLGLHCSPLQSPDRSVITDKHNCFSQEGAFRLTCLWAHMWCSHLLLCLSDGFLQHVREVLHLSLQTVVITREGSQGRLQRQEVHSHTCAHRYSFIHTCVGHVSPQNQKTE